ncbi:hypothetical protein [Beduinella massiliensis]|uniref:hypothetical protein n=1 Tax=Beduinella massiliensis TaxID=1852363 RepID=UPI000C8495CC
MDVLIVIGLVVWAIVRASQKQVKNSAGQAAKAMPRAPQGEWQQMLGRFAEAAKQISEDPEEMPKVEEQPAPSHKRMHKKEGGAPILREASAVERSARVEHRLDAERMSRMQPRTVTQEEMEQAGEGEDPCHELGTPSYAAPQPRMQHAQDVQDEAQELLRGIILSEILTKPQDRRRMRMR